jgi:aspartate/methionine/tyrosine aminotransferase
MLLFHASQGMSEIGYLPPMYYNAAWWVRRLGLSVWRAAADIDFAEESALTLPERRTLLWISDPLWFAGVSLRAETIAAVADWQRATGSTVIVDGTFQYMRWSGPTREFTSGLDPDRTFRLVCPTKALALHGFRFAYAIVPESCAADFSEFHIRLHGTSGLVDSKFAHRAVEVLAGPSGAAPLMELAQRRYLNMLHTGKVVDLVRPEGGYFAFVKLATDVDSIVGMDADCFGTSQYRNFLRVNLLNDPVAAGLGFHTA